MKEFDFRVWCNCFDGLSSNAEACLACNGELKVWPEWEQLEFVFSKDDSNESKKVGDDNT